VGQCVAVCGSVWQCVAVCGSVLQRVEGVYCTRACVKKKKMFSNMSTFFNIILYRVAKTHRIPYLYRSFSAKETYI